MQDRSRSGATDNCINCYPEHSDGDDGPAISLLLSTPGYILLATIGTGPIRGAYRAANNLMYVVSGNKLYVVTAAWAATLIGAIGSSTGPVKMIDNPTQLLVVDGTGGWVVVKATNAFSQVIPNGTTDAKLSTVAVYQDGFGLVNSNDNQIYQSNYNDLSSFASLNGGGLGSTANNAFIQGNAENVVSMIDFKREVWIFKSDAVEVWVNQGASGFAFSQLQGVNPDVGCEAPGSVVKVGDSIAWLGSDENGNCMVYISVGYQAKPILTHALSAMFQGFSVTSDAIAYAYQSGMHTFYVLTFPTANMTFAYDLATGKWHQRGYYSNGSYGRELANCHCFFNRTHVVGDYTNGNIYALDENTYTDNLNPKRWLRSWRALTPSNPVGVPMSFDELQILMETGATVPSGTVPQVTLRWSDDGGYSWIGQVIIPAGRIGQTSWRVIGRRFGSTKIGTGLDRIWEISGTDPIRVAITGASWEGGPT